MEDYSKREIDHFVRDIKDTLERIEAQVTKTNGRVTKLEIWRWMITGALILLAFLIGNQLLTLL